jgi:hypothetical protein
MKIKWIANIGFKDEELKGILEVPDCSTDFEIDRLVDKAVIDNMYCIDWEQISD